MGDFQALDQYLSELVKTGPAGCGCMAIRAGEVIYENYFGYADLEKNIPITPDSIYRQFSTTKIVTCTAAMTLFEQGKFLLDDPVSEYFPEWKNSMTAEKLEDGSYKVRPVKNPVTVKDCFTMSMGIGYTGDDYTHQMAAAVREELKANMGSYTLRDEIRAMARVPLAFDPGEHWLYGYGHELVAGLIEVVSGKKVSEYIKEAILEPLGMDDTGYRFFGDTRERMVKAYKAGEEGRVPAAGFLDALHEPDCTYDGGGFGLFSTVSDYSRFMQALANGGSYKGQKIIGRKTIDLMRRNQLDPVRMQEFSKPNYAGYGYGLGVRTMIDPKNANSTEGAFGWQGMLGTYAEADPAEKLSIVYMHNYMSDINREVHHRVRHIIYGAIE